MRLSVKALGVAPLLVAAVPLPSLSSPESIPKGASSSILELGIYAFPTCVSLGNSLQASSDVLNAYAKFQLACPDCFRQEKADDALVCNPTPSVTESPCLRYKDLTSGTLSRPSTLKSFAQRSLVASLTYLSMVSYR